jgi:hypothetical protein
MTKPPIEPNMMSQAYYQYPAHSGSPPMYSSASGLATSAPSNTVDDSIFALTIKTLRCEWSECSVMMPITAGRERDCVRAHFEHHHVDVLQSRSAREERYCLWKDCRCLCRRGGRCAGRPRGHTAHARNIFNHVWQAHAEAEVKN